MEKEYKSIRTSRKEIMAFRKLGRGSIQTSDTAIKPGDTVVLHDLRCSIMCEFLVEKVDMFGVGKIRLHLMKGVRS